MLCYFTLSLSLFLLTRVRLLGCFHEINHESFNELWLLVSLLAKVALVRLRVAVRICIHKESLDFIFGFHVDFLFAFLSSKSYSNRFVRWCDIYFSCVILLIILLLRMSLHHSIFASFSYCRWILIDLIVVIGMQNQIGSARVVVVLFFYCGS